MKKCILAYDRLNEDQLAAWVKRGDWQASIGPEHFGSDVHGKTLGMVGFGRIGAAGLDVFEQEPRSPLPHMANVVTLPYIGSTAHETRTTTTQRAVDKLILALQG